MKLPESVSAKTIASILSLPEPTTDLSIKGLSEIHRAEKGELTFIDHPRYYTYVNRSEATFFLINTRLEAPADKVLIYSDDPFRDYNRLVRKYFPSPIIHQNEVGQVGAGTIISEGAVIGKNVHIGSNCFIHPNVVIHDHCKIHDRVTIAANTTIGSNAFYYQRQKTGIEPLYSIGGVEIFNDVDIGPNCTVNRGVSSITTIKNGTKIDSHVHIGHGAVIGQSCIIAGQTSIAGKAILEDNVTIWGIVGIVSGVRIGENAVIQASSLVTKSLPGNETYFGNPAGPEKVRKKELVMLRKLPAIWNKISRNNKK